MWGWNSSVIGYWYLFWWPYIFTFISMWLCNKNVLIYNYNGLEAWCKIVCYSSWICLSFLIVITCSVVPQRSKTLGSGMVFAPTGKMGLVYSIFVQVHRSAGVLFLLFNAWHHWWLHSTLRANDLLAKCTLIGNRSTAHSISLFLAVTPSADNRTVANDSLA